MLSQSFTYYFKELLYYNHCSPLRTRLTGFHCMAFALFLLSRNQPMGIKGDSTLESEYANQSERALYHLKAQAILLHIDRDIILSCRKQACKGKKPVENGESSHHSEPYESSSDSENEVLIERIKKARVKARSDGRKEKKCQNASKTSVTTRGSENRHSNKFCARQELHQQGIDSPTPSTSTDIQEDDFSIVTIIQPTPQPDKKRSIFTKRQHRPPSTSFDHLEDFAVSDTEMQQDQSSGLTNHHLKTISNHKRAENALVHKSGIVIKLDKSPFIKKKKPQRRRVMSLSSDSD